MKNKKGFTLAEVLVTLAVIGVVAALTIPALIQSSNTRTAQTSFRKAVSILNQALTMSIAQDGIDAGCSNCSAPEGLRAVFDGYLSALTSNATSITTTDGMIYTFYSDGTVCDESVTNNDPSGAHCVIEVDINADRGDESASTSDNAGATNYNDLYYLVVLQQSIVPANDGDAEDYDPLGVGTFRASAAATIGNIALEALLN